MSLSSSHFLYAIYLSEVQSIDMVLLAAIDRSMEPIKVKESTPKSFLKYVNLFINSSQLIEVYYYQNFPVRVF